MASPMGFSPFEGEGVGRLARAELGQGTEDARKNEAEERRAAGPGIAMRPGPGAVDLAVDSIESMWSSGRWRWSSF